MLLGLELDIDGYESEKDRPHLDFHGHTPRDIYIRMFTDFLQPIFGSGIMGELWMREFHKYKNTPDIQAAEYIIVSGLGCYAELRPLIEYFTGSQILVMRIHSPDSTFDCDCREYIYATECYSCDVRNLMVGEHQYVDDIGEQLNREGFID